VVELAYFAFTLLPPHNCNFQVDELKTSPNDVLSQSAPTLAALDLDKELNAGIMTSELLQGVNDLTGMIKKKKKTPTVIPSTSTDNIPIPETSTAKRKAEEESEGSSTEKKAKLETS